MCPLCLAFIWVPRIGSPCLHSKYSSRGVVSQSLPYHFLTNPHLIFMTLCCWMEAPLLTQRGGERTALKGPQPCTGQQSWPSTFNVVRLTPALTGRCVDTCGCVTACLRSGGQKSAVLSVGSSRVLRLCPCGGPGANVFPCLFNLLESA